MDPLLRLQQVAEGATPGPWYSDAVTVEVDHCLSASRREAGLPPATASEWSVSVETSHVIIADCGTGYADVPPEEVTRNADFIATFNPEMVLKLLAVVRAATDVYPSDDPGEEEHERFDRLAAALAAVRESVS